MRMEKGSAPRHTDAEEPWWGHLVAPGEAKSGVSLQELRSPKQRCPRLGRE